MVAPAKIFLNRHADHGGEFSDEKHARKDGSEDERGAMTRLLGVVPGKESNDTPRDTRDGREPHYLNMRFQRERDIYNVVIRERERVHISDVR